MRASREELCCSKKQEKPTEWRTTRQTASKVQGRENQESKGKRGAEDPREEDMGDSEFSASELRRRYHRGGTIKDDEMTSAQLRAKYAIPGNRPGRFTQQSA